MDFQIEFLRTLSNMRSAFTDFLFQFITRFGEEIIVFAVICILFWCIDKNSAYKLALVFFASGIMVQGLKISFKIDRPFVIDPTFKPVESAVAGATGYSFPSGHTQGATALYGYFALNTKQKWLKIVFCLLILLVMFSRLYLGVHTPMDVMVSFLVTLISLILINKFYDKMASDKNLPILVSILGVVSVILAIYAFILTSVGYIEAKYVSDCYKSAGAGLGFALGVFIEKKYINFDVKSKNIFAHAVKLICGVAGALILKSVPKLILPGNPIMDFIRYFLTIIFVVAVYPYIFTKVQNKLNTQKA